MGVKRALAWTESTGALVRLLLLWPAELAPFPQWRVPGLLVTAEDVKSIDHFVCSFTPLAVTGTNCALI